MKIAVFILVVSACLWSQPSLWSPRGIGGGGALFSPSINPADGNEFYMSCDMSEQFHTMDFGRNYGQANFQYAQGGQFGVVRFTNGPVRYCLTSVGDYVVPRRSMDNGTTWADCPGTPYPEDYAYYLYVDFNNPARVLLSYYDEVYSSLDSGRTFNLVYTAANSGSGVVLGGVFFDGHTIYAGTNDGLLVSTNDGQSFAVQVVSGIASGEAIWSMAGAKSGTTVRLYCLTGSSGDIYVGLWGGDYWGFFQGIYSLSVVSGITGSWLNRTANLDNAADFPMFLAMADNDTATCYAAGSNSSGSPTVYKTTNSGGSWTQTFQSAGNVNVVTGWSGQSGDRGWGYGECALGFAVSPSDKNRLVVTDYGFAHVSSNGGATWRQAYIDSSSEHAAGQNTPKGATYRSIGLENTTCWQVLWIDRDNMFACYSDIRGIRSADAGATWSFNYTGTNANTIYRMVKHPNGVLYAGTSNIHDMYQSTRLTDNIISANDAEGKVILSTDSGRTWQAMHTFNHPVFWVALDPTNTNRMYASVIDSAIGGVYVCNNIQNGATSAWTKLAAPPRTQGHPAGIVVLNDGKVVCTYSGRRTSSGFTASSGLFMYDPSNTQWTDLSDPGMYYWTKDIVLDPFDGAQNTWYVSVFSGWGGAPNGLGGLYKTMDRGAHWARISDLDRVTSCTFNPGDQDEIYLTTETEGLWKCGNVNAASPAFSLVGTYPFRQPERVFFNPYDSLEMWVTSFGNGMKVGRINGSAVEETLGRDTMGFTLHAWPNPFNPVVNIRLQTLAVRDMKKTEKARIGIYTVDGKMVTLLTADYPLFSTGIVWDAFTFPSGVYIVQARAGAFTAAKRIMLLK